MYVMLLHIKIFLEIVMKYIQNVNQTIDLLHFQPWKQDSYTKGEKTKYGSLDLADMALKPLASKTEKGGIVLPGAFALK